MINSNRKAVLTAFILTGTFIILLSVTQSFKGFSSSPDKGMNQVFDTIYNIRTFDLPANITFAGEKMPLDNFDTKESLERELLISAYRHSSTMLIIMRAHRYLPMIEKILKKNNIPEDFKYLVAAESDYSNVVSPAGATGFWQIMPETGRENGMEINSVVDERYDIEKSTQFACDFFKKSYDKYGNWTLAAASYNGGRGAVDDQIEIQHQKNYYDLLLSEETVDTVVTDFTAFAQKFGTNYKILKLLNPWLRKPYLTPKTNKEYLIKIPSEGMRNIENTEVGN
jgi:membrane-bound lytic murein transglycosylase D